MNAAIETGTTSSAPELCSVVVLYDDVSTRTRALSACDCLVSLLWESVELDFHWWRTDFLKDPHMARAAAHHAIASDFLFVCSNETETVSASTEAWFESWIDRRGNREGALIDLTVSSPSRIAPPHRQVILRSLARRGWFDYLNAVPEPGKTDARPPEPVKPPPIETRPEHLRPPSHFGLNE